MKTQDKSAPQGAWFDEMFQPAGVIPFEFEGRQFYAKSPALELVLRDLMPTPDSTALQSMHRACKLLSVCLVDANGQSIKTADEFMRIDSRHAQHITDLAIKVGEVIGMNRAAAQVEDAGNESEATCD